MTSKQKLLVGLAVVLGLVAMVVLMSPEPGPRSVQRVNDVDLELQAAASKAQESLPGFIEELAKKPEGSRFAVKGMFETPSGPEYLWVKDPTFSEDTFRGVLDQQPIAYQGATKGDEVSVKRPDVFDWMIESDGTRRGAFTEEVLQGRR